MFDDFGTGYASLSYLKKFPLDGLKIDRSFVFDLLSDPDDAAIVSSTIVLSKQLGLSVIAEGIENRATADLLATMGCEEGQGYFFGRPMPASEFERQFLASPDKPIRCSRVKARDQRACNSYNCCVRIKFVRRKNAQCNCLMFGTEPVSSWGVYLQQAADWSTLENLGASSSLFDAFSSREPVSTSLENALACADVRVLLRVHQLADGPDRAREPLGEKSC